MAITINCVYLQMMSYYLQMMLSPVTFAPNLLKVLKDFGQISGLQVNPTKFKALNISTPTAYTSKNLPPLPLVYP